MKTKIRYTFLSLCMLMFAGCNGFVESEMTNDVTDKLVFSKPEYAQAYLDDFYRYLPLYFSFNTHDSSVGITEGLTDTFKYSSNVPGTNVGFANLFVLGDLGLMYSTVSFHLGAWTATYDRIRRVNEFLFLMNKYANFDTATTESFTAQARFIRAFLYWQILKRTDPAILFEENMDAIQKNKPLNTSDQCWNYVEADLDYAARILPDTWNSQNAGRVTKGAAYALKSRAMLYANRWQAAKDAAAEVFKLDYHLMGGSTGADYTKAFTSSSAGNTESILEYRYMIPYPNHNFNKKFSPRGDGNSTNFGEGAASPTQEMVECYEYAGGGGVDWSAWHTAIGTSTTPPYELLEPRFQASILYNGATWKGRKIETFDGGIDGWIEFNGAEPPAGRSVTGYYLRKLIDEKHIEFSGSTPSTQPAILIRLAEVYLNHAEACFQLSDNAGANASLKKVRERVNLPHADLSGSTLMDAIRKERKVELAFEGHLYWDMRRWKLAHEEYNGPQSRVHGFKIARSGAVDTYFYIDCDRKDRIFLEKMYRIPLPADEINNNSLVNQFPEWL